MKLPDKPFVLVLWMDPNSTGQTTVVTRENLDALHALAPIITAGWVLKQDAKGISVACEWLDDDDYRGMTFIPTAAITEVRPVKLPTKQRKQKKEESQDGRE
jgi:hypothetical protein